MRIRRRWKRIREVKEEEELKEEEEEE